MPENDSMFMSLFIPPDAIIDKLTNSGHHLPEAALNAAGAMPETMTPILLQHLERLAADPQSIPADDDWLAFYALFLLAKFKEGKTLPLLWKMLEKEPESLDWLLGDGLTELGSRLFASWAASSPDALRPFIENRKLDEFVRSEALEAYQCLYCNKVVTEEEMRPYLHTLAHEILRQEAGGEESLLWYTWVQCCFTFGLEEFRPLAKKAFDEQWVEPLLATWKDGFELSEERCQGRGSKKYATFITDIAEELRDWHCFSEAYREEMRRKEEGYEEDLRDWADNAPSGAFVRTTPKIGPNQPCPCGSGKKYKKCCKS